MTDTFPPWLAHTAKKFPDRIALQYQQQSWTYAQLFQAAFRFAQSNRISSQSRIAVISKNSPEQAIASHGIMLAGGTIAHINHRLTAGEIQSQIDRISPDTVFCQNHLWEKTAQVSPDIPVRSLDDIKLYPGQPHSVSTPQILPNRTCAIFMTSGTTGLPKAVQLSYGNFIASAIGSGLNMGIHADDKWLACLPVDHIGGFSILVRSVIYGTAVFLHPGFEVHRIKTALERDKVTLGSLVPAMLNQLHDENLNSVESVRAILLGGGPMEKRLIEHAWTQGLPVLPSYGLTEACSQVTTMPPESIPDKPGSAGKPLPFTTVKILSEDGMESSTGDIGEILVKGPTVMRGYLDDKEANRQTLQDGWLHTGDYGFLDNDGFLHTVSRRQDLIVSGGENIYPEEVEAALLKHPGIRDVCVFGIEDKIWGQKVVAAVVPDDRSHATSLNFSAEDFPDLAPFKFPKEFVQVEAIPRTPIGKVKRRALKKRFSDTTSE